MRMPIRAITVFLLVLLPAAVLAEYVGSTQSDRYHRTNCIVVRKIEKPNRLVFATAAEAVKAGYKPCRKCNPPLPGKQSMPTGPSR